jgi:hypothetical protein
MRTLLCTTAVIATLFVTACGGGDPSAGAPAVDDSNEVQTGTTTLAEQRPEAAERLAGTQAPANGGSRTSGSNPRTIRIPDQQGYAGSELGLVQSPTYGTPPDDNRR